MTPSERVTNLANAISDGMNCIAHLQSLRAAPPIALAEDLKTWCDTLAECSHALGILRTGTLDGRPLTTSWRPADDVVPAVEKVRSRLVAITPGTVLPPTLFDLVDVAWAEIAKDAP